MKFVRYALGLVGSAVALLAFASVLGTPIPLPVDAAVSAVGNDYQFVVAFGIAAGVVVLGVLGQRTVEGVSQSTPPAPERVTSGPAPGAEYDQYAESGLSIRERLFGDGGEEVRAELRETAVKTTMRTEDCDRETAIERVESGSWTDDETAAAFVGGSVSTGVGARIGGALRGESGFQRGIRRTADAIDRKAEEVRR
ncbi:DUF7269 family protein [Halorussus halophilus]|uniref:DUF7269 family protein n=1 Tax=Halorussus halophilus TaxID=2650975 RepID=UPI001300DA66|nr:hypothetical protein [Halorussus halophilus]